MRENVFTNMQVSSPGYRIAGRSNLLATPAAGTDALGHLVALRNATTRLWIIARMRVTLAADATTAQEFGLTVFKATGYSASHTGGLAMTAEPCLTAGQAPAIADVPAATEIRIADTAPLTDGTHAALTRVVGGKSIYMGTVAAGQGAELCWEWEMQNGKGIALQNNEGIIIPNLVLGGAGSAVRAWFEADLTLA